MFNMRFFFLILSIRKIQVITITDFIIIRCWAHLQCEYNNFAYKRFPCRFTLNKLRRREIKTEKKKKTKSPNFNAVKWLLWLCHSVFNTFRQPAKDVQIVTKLLLPSVPHIRREKCHCTTASIWTFTIKLYGYVLNVDVCT